MSGHDKTFFDAYGNEQNAPSEGKQPSQRLVSPVRRKAKSPPATQNYNDAMDLYSDGQQHCVDPPVNDPYQGRVPTPQQPTPQQPPRQQKLDAQLHFSSGSNIPHPAAPAATNFEPVPSSAIRIEEDGPYVPTIAFPAPLAPESFAPTEPQIQTESYRPEILAPAPAETIPEEPIFQQLNGEQPSETGDANALPLENATADSGEIPLVVETTTPEFSLEALLTQSNTTQVGSFTLAAEFAMSTIGEWTAAELPPASSAPDHETTDHDTNPLENDSQENDSQENTNDELAGDLAKGSNEVIQEDVESPDVESHDVESHDVESHDVESHDKDSKDYELSAVDEAPETPASPELQDAPELESACESAERVESTEQLETEKVILEFKLVERTSAIRELEPLELLAAEIEAERVLVTSGIVEITAQPLAETSAIPVANDAFQATEQAAEVTEQIQEQEAGLNHSTAESTQLETESELAANEETKDVEAKVEETATTDEVNSTDEVKTEADQTVVGTIGPIALSELTADDVAEQTDLAAASDADQASADVPLSEEASKTGKVELGSVGPDLSELKSEHEEASEVGEVTAEWEVDEFLWASACRQLMEQEQEYFMHAGRRLADTTREGVHVLAVTGSQRGEGRTTLAMCLARCAADAGVRVAMVDADLQRPSLGRRLGVEAPCSWQDVLLTEAPLGEAIVYSEEDNISLVPLNDTDEPHMKLDDDRVTKLIDELSKQFDLVVVDCGPINDYEADFFERGSACPVDAAIVVRDLRASSNSEVYETVQQLHDAGVVAVGIAENFGAEQAAAKAA
jgi:Mrp family chromosome partitioning ATPase